MDIDVFKIKINEICQTKNFEIVENKSLIRCLDSSKRLLCAYKINSKSILIYLDLNDKVSNLSNLHIASKFKIEKVVNVNSTYYSNKITIKTHEEMLEILEVLENLKIEDLRIMTTKRGLSRVRETISQLIETIFKRKLKFGIELELVVNSKDELRQKLVERGIQVVDPNSTHEVVNGWKLVRDASITVNTYDKKGVELVSPPSYNFDELKIVCEVLKEIGAKVNRSCGLHVHHDIHQLPRKQIMRIYNFYNKYEEVINSMMPSHRVDNEYCKGISGIINNVNDCSTINELLKRIAGKGHSNYYNSVRYYTVNLRSFLYYGTIEFRQGFSTIDYDTIKEWITFTHKIIERSIQIGEDIEYNLSGNKEESFEEMIKELKLENTYTMENLKKRFKRYKRR